MKIRSLWITLTAVAFLAVVAPASASAESDPQEPTFSITGTTNSSVSIEWIDHSTNEDGFKVQMRRPSTDDDWTDVLDLRDHRAGQPQATGWTYAQTFNTAVSPQVRAVCLRVKAYNDSGSSDWTLYQCTMPDLILSALSVPFSIGHGKPFTLGFGACNLSNVDTGRYSVLVSVLARESRNLAMPSLAPRDCYFQTIQMFGLPVGNHSVSVHLDSLGEVIEAFENNNFGVGSIKVT